MTSLPRPSTFLSAGAAFAASTALVLTGGLAASAEEPPPGPIHGPYVSDPQVPNPALDLDGEEVCELSLFDQEFADWDIHTSDLAALEACGHPEEWSGASLTVSGSVAGVQYDRLGWIRLDGTTITLLSTPEPSRDGLSWSVEKDVSPYLDLLKDADQAEMFLGNTVTEGLDGVFDMEVTLTVHAGGAERDDVPDAVIPVADAQGTHTGLTGTVQTPRNTTRVLAEVYALGWGGGCEEFWDLMTPPESGTGSCNAESKHREVEVYIDGTLAGTAMPYGVVFTGGWSNPYLWQPSPSPHAFDVPALTYDLTPFAGVLNDGQAHGVEIVVAGISEESSGWYVAPNLQVWTDESRDVIPGGLDSVADTGIQLDQDVVPAGEEDGSYTLRADREVVTTGHLDLPRGRVTTTVTSTLTEDSTHTWTADLNRDDLTSQYTDHQVTETDNAKGPDYRRERTTDWHKNGTLLYTPLEGDAWEVMTDLDIAHAATEGTAKLNPHGKIVKQSSRTDTSAFDGQATWQSGGPREERRPVSEQTASFTVEEDGVLTYEKVLTARNGVYLAD